MKTLQKSPSWMVIGLLMTAFIFPNYAAGNSTGSSVIKIIFGRMLGKLIAKGLTTHSKADVEKAIVRLTKEANQNLPITINNLTRLDHITTGPGLRITFNNTLTTIPTLSIDSQKFEQIMQTQIRTEIRQNNDVLPFLRNGVTLAFTYEGKDGGYIGMASVLPQDCDFK